MGMILSHIVSNVMHIGEKFVLCLAAISVVSCLVFTFTMMLVLGIGLGYNYCFVDFNTRHKYVKGYYKYTVLPSTVTRRTVRYRYPSTLYPPHNEWFQHTWAWSLKRRSGIGNETDVLEFNIEDLNATDFEKLNASLDYNELNSLLKEMNFNGTLPESFAADYYANADLESRAVNAEINDVTPPMSKESPTSTPIVTLLMMLKSTPLPISISTPTSTSTPTSSSTSMPIPLTLTSTEPTQSDTLTSEAPVQLQSQSSENVMETLSNHTKTVLHLNGLDLFALLAKLKTENKNYTVKIETN